MRRTRRGLIVLLVITSSSCTIFATPKRALFHESPILLNDSVLPNGLRLVVEQDTGATMVGVALTISAGGYDDPVGREGLAHFIEHLSYRKRLGNGLTLQTWLNAAGVAGDNAATTVDSTTYFASGPRDSLAALLLAAAAELDGPKDIEPSLFATERGVVGAEMRRGSDTSSHSALVSWVGEALYPAGHPSARSLLGTPASLAAITQADVDAFLVAHYRPSRATLAITGGVDDELLRQALAQAFGDGGSGERRVEHEPLEVTLEKPPEPPSQRLRRHDAPVSNEELYLAWSLPNQFGHPSVLKELRARVDGWGQSLVGDEPDVRRFTTTFRRDRHSAQIISRVTLRPGSNPDRVFETVTNRLDRKIDLISPSSKRYVHASGRVGLTLMTSMERAFTRAQRAQLENDATFDSSREPPFGDADWVPELKWLDGKRARAVYVKPTFARRSGSSGLREVESERAATETVPAPTPLGVSAEQLERLAISVGAKSARIEVFESGLQALVLDAPQYAVTSVVLLQPAGTALGEPAGAAELGHILGESNVIGLEAAWASGAGRSALNRLPDEVTLTLEGNAGDLAAMVSWLKYKLLGRWRVNRSRLNELMSELKKPLEQLAIAPLARSAASFSRALWGNNAYQPATFSQLDAVSDDDIERWLNRSTAPDQSVLVVVGDVDSKGAMETLHAQLDDLPQRGLEPVRPVAGAQGHSASLVVPLASMTQVGIRWACRADATDARAAARTSLVATWLTSVLNDMLRERSGASYENTVTPTRYWGGAAMLSASFDVAASQLPTILAAMNEALSLEPTADRLLDAGWHLLRRRNLHFELSAPLALELARATRDGWAPETIDTYASTLTSLGIDELRASLTDCRKTQVYSFIGDPSVIESAAREASLTNAAQP